MYVVAVEFRAVADRVQDLREALCRQARNSLVRERDCHGFDVCQDPDDPARFFLYELYSDAAAFDVHLASAHFHDFDATVQPWIESKTVRVWTRVYAGEGGGAS